MMRREGITSWALVVLCLGFQNVRLEDSFPTPTTSTGTGNEGESDLVNSVLQSGESSPVLSGAALENSLENRRPGNVSGEGGALDAWEAPFNIAQDYAYYLSGFDDENRPIWVFELGRWNLRAVIEAGGAKLAAFDKYMEQLVHRLIKSTETRSTPDFPVSEIMFLVDFDELKLEQLAHVPTVSYVLKLSREYTDLLVLHLGGTFIVNTNFVASNLINILRPVFGPLLERVEVYGNNKASWLPKVLRRLPRDQLPEWYGGPTNFKPVKVYG